MMKNEMLALLVVVAMKSIQSAEPARSESPSFVNDGLRWSKVMTRGIAVELCAGKVIAYETNNPYLKDEDSYLHMFRGKPAYYGYINPLPKEEVKLSQNLTLGLDERAVGYELSHLLKIDADPYPVMLTTKNIRDSHFYLKIRFIKPTEKAAIYAALKNGKAKFADISSQDAGLLAALGVENHKRKMGIFGGITLARARVATT